MNKYFDSRAFIQVILIVLLGFFPVWFVVPYNVLDEILRSVAVAVGAGIVYAYSRGLYTGWKANKIDYGYLLVVGIVFSWFGLILAVSLGWLRDWLSGGELLWHSILMAFAIWLFIFGGILHLTAQDAINGYIPRSHWVRISTYIVAGTVLGLLLLRFVVVR